MKMDHEDLFKWNVDALDGGLKKLSVTVETYWSKLKKVFEFNMAIK